MANDFYHSKDKMDLARSNPRNQTFGAMSSSDMQYKNYLAGMKPRVKTPDKGKESGRPSSSNNFRLSAGVTDHDEDNEKLKASKVLYNELASVPNKKSNSDLSYNQNKGPNTKPKPRTSSSSESEEKTDLLPSVGKLRSMFDSPTNSTPGPPRPNHISPPRLKDDTNRRDPYKRYSGSDQLQHKPKNDIRQIDVNVVAKVKNKVDDEPKEKAPKGTLNIDAMCSLDNTDEPETNGESNVNERVNTKNKSEPIIDNTSTSKTKGMHGLLTRKKSSEFADDFEDRIVPIGTKTIDISSLLAPSPADDNNNQDDNEDKNGEQSTLSPEFDLQKKRELERLLQAQQEVKAQKAFNLKRRSLKDRLSEMSSLSQQDSFDNVIVSYELPSEPVKEPAINIDNHFNQTPTHIEEESSKISPVMATKDKQSEIINECIVTSDPQRDSPEVVSIKAVTDELTDSKDGTAIECSLSSDASLDDSISFKCNNLGGVAKEELDEIPKLNVNFDKNDIDVGDIVEESLEMNILNGENTNIESGEESDDSHDEEKNYDSIVDRFDAFLTSHGIADPEILSPVTVSSESDVFEMINGQLETSSSFDGKIEMHDDSKDISLTSELSGDIDVSVNDDDISLENFNPDAHSSQDDLSIKPPSISEEPGESEMDLMNEIIGHLENKELEVSARPANDASSTVVKTTPKLLKQEKLDLDQSKTSGDSIVDNDIHSKIVKDAIEQDVKDDDANECLKKTDIQIKNSVELIANLKVTADIPSLSETVDTNKSESKNTETLHEVLSAHSLLYALSSNEGETSTKEEMVNDDEKSLYETHLENMIKQEDDCECPNKSSPVIDPSVLPEPSQLVIKNPLNIKPTKSNLTKLKGNGNSNRVSSLFFCLCITLLETWGLKVPLHCFFMLMSKQWSFGSKCYDFS